MVSNIAPSNPYKGEGYKMPTQKKFGIRLKGTEKMSNNKSCCRN